MASSLEGNKIIAAILTAGIIASASGVFSRIIYKPDALEENAYKIEVAVAEDAAGGEDAVEATPIATLLASANPDNGATVAKKCAACHTFEKGGADKVGPHLWDVVGRDIGGADGYAYSSAMAGHGGTWDYEALNHFLEKPKDYVPGTKMSFAGLRKETDRADLIAYMRTLSDSPQPLPEG
ncbi:cytochrome c family protein [Geminicoccaceae bacterium 1502E]|nr:cytochrome c family protein [Geminicoccaceae bacterium 1502E]